MDKRLSGIDYGELKFPIVAYIITHPECWDVKLATIFRGREDATKQGEE